MISDCKLICLANIREESDRRKIIRIESFLDIEFEICRIFYMYGLDETMDRGNHSHNDGYQLIIAANGNFSVKLDDGRTQKTFYLNNKKNGLIVGPRIWRVLSNFSKDAVCLVFNSSEYDEKNTVRDYSLFLNSVN